MEDVLSCGMLADLIGYHEDNFNGPALSFDDDGSLIREGYYRNGDREGLYREYEHGGIILLEEHYSTASWMAGGRFLGNSGMLTEEETTKTEFETASAVFTIQMVCWMPSILIKAEMFLDRQKCITITATKRLKVSLRIIWKRVPGKNTIKTGNCNRRGTSCMEKKQAPGNLTMKRKCCEATNLPGR